MRNVLTQPQLANQVMAPKSQTKTTLGASGTSTKPPIGNKEDTHSPPPSVPVQAAVPTTNSGELKAAIESQVPNLEEGGPPRAALNRAAIELDIARTIFYNIASPPYGAEMAQCAEQMTEVIGALAIAQELLGASAAAFRDAGNRL